jgi:hypothetical protein
MSKQFYHTLSLSNRGHPLAHFIRAQCSARLLGFDATRLGLTTLRAVGRRPVRHGVYGRDEGADGDVTSGAILGTPALSIGTKSQLQIYETCHNVPE